MSDEQDRQISCIDCGTTFTFTANDQTFYKANQFADPKRCRPCRKKKRAQFEQSEASRR